MCALAISARTTFRGGQSSTLIRRKMSPWRLQACVGIDPMNVIVNLVPAVLQRADDAKGEVAVLGFEVAPAEHDAQRLRSLPFLADDMYRKRLCGRANDVALLNQPIDLGGTAERLEVTDRLFNAPLGAKQDAATAGMCIGLNHVADTSHQSFAKCAGPLTPVLLAKRRGRGRPSDSWDSVPRRRRRRV
jgi:hypothetical protein